MNNPLFGEPGAYSNGPREQVKMLSAQDKTIHSQAVFTEEHLQLLKPLKIIDRHRQERVLMPNIRELRGTPFALCADEVNFTKGLMDTHARCGLRKHNLWVYRSHQAKFAGDFVIVDVSSPPKRVGKLLLPDWEVFVLDLKMGDPIKFGGKGAGIQFKHWSRAVWAAMLSTARSKAFYPTHKGAQTQWHRYAQPKAVWRLVGDRSELLSFFKHLKLLRRERRRVRGDMNELNTYFRHLCQ